MQQAHGRGSPNTARFNPSVHAVQLSRFVIGASFHDMGWDIVVSDFAIHVKVLSC